MEGRGSDHLLPLPSLSQSQIITMQKSKISYETIQQNTTLDKYKKKSKKEDDKKRSEEKEMS